MAANGIALANAGGAPAGIALSPPGGMTTDEKEEILGDLEALTEKVEKVFTAVKVLQITVKDLPRKNKEDDPHYKPYSNYMQSIGPPLSSKHDRSQEAINSGKSRSPRVPKLNLPGQTTPNTSFARDQLGKQLNENSFDLKPEATILAVTIRQVKAANKTPSDRTPLK